MLKTPAILLGVLALAAGDVHAASGWMTDYDKALKESKSSGKPVLADFTGSDWCGWCIRLKKEVFDKDEFKRWAEDSVVLLELDFPRLKDLPEELAKQNQRLAQKYSIRGYPTILFLDGSGEVLAQSGYLAGGPTAWIEDAAGKLGDALPSEEAPAEDVAWLTSYDKAVEAARAGNKLILADFTGSDWCGWCVRLKKEVFDTPEFKRWAAEHVVLLELDFPRRTAIDAETREQNEKLAKKYAVRGFPTILFLDASGARKGQLGYMAGGPSEWLPAADKILEESRKRSL